MKQGCVLSPVLFNLFIHDLPNIFDHSCDPVTLHDVKFSCLMFADDLVLASESSQGLQACLDKIGQYCNKWGLTVNLKKTKIIIFNKTGKLLHKYKFYYNNIPVELTDAYCYLGILFTPSGTFTHAITRLTEQALKALFKLKQLDLANNIPVALNLFDILIMPILRYCSEIWSPYFIKDINSENLLSLADKLPMEKIHTKFCKFLLGVNRKATNIAVRAELGRRPVLIDLMVHGAKYWLHLTGFDKERLVYKAYLDLYTTCGRIANWTCHIKKIWENYNMPEIWLNQGTKYKHKITRILRRNIISNYDKQWRELINKEDSKLRTYKLFKTNIGIENYLMGHTNIANRKEFTKLRLSAHQLQIERGRYTVPKTPPDQRICKYCTNQCVESEQHFLLSCPLYRTEREDMIEYLNTFTTYSTMSDQEKLIFLMSYNNGDMEVVRPVQHFINKCMEKRSVNLGPSAPTVLP